MAPQAQIWCVVLLCLASVALGGRMIQEGGSACKSLSAGGVKTMTFRSPALYSIPGLVNNKYFVGEAPKGHIGIRDFFAELVDENGAPVPLSDVYLHHWVMLESLVPKKHSARHVNHLLKRMRGQDKHGMSYHATDMASFEAAGSGKVRENRRKFLNFLGKGGETRKTHTKLPAPYATESGNPSVVVDGFENVWVLNVHGLDTRLAVNPMGCAECRCALFNATTGEEGEPLPEGYIGGLRCCTDERRCAVKEGNEGKAMTYYLQYTWEYVEWDECVVPVTQIGTDVTNADGFSENLTEFTVEGCGNADPNSEECVDTRVATYIVPKGGDIVLVSSHLHAAALNATIWGEDGRLICETSPMYGQGHEAGNEKGYVVGIRSCYGEPGSRSALKIVQGEKLTYVVQSTKVGGPHTGLMGLVGITIDPSGVSASF